MEEVIKFENVVYRIQKRAIIDHISFSVKKGETKVILGGSGGGKTTILKLILGLIPPDSGRIYLFGKDITKMEEEEVNELRKRIGMVFQSGALFESLTVEENVAYPLVEMGFPEDKIKKRVKEVLALLNLSGTEEMMPAELSGGMRKRVAIARALVSSPEVILYDEPTTGVDPILAKTIVEHIKKLKEELGVTSVVVTHELRYAFMIGDSFAMLKSGKIVFDGSKEELLEFEDDYVRAFVS
jgi:phospholipid/cholesterol/gamma-HCH transport system ATP-binding protein